MISDKPAILLASKSPRRQELLAQLEVSFELIAVDVDETPLAEEVAADYVRRLAIEKAQAGRDQVAGAIPVLGSDTIVVVDGQILGKPLDQQDAAAHRLGLHLRHDFRRRTRFGVFIAQRGISVDSDFRVPGETLCNLSHRLKRNLQTSATVSTGVRVTHPPA